MAPPVPLPDPPLADHAIRLRAWHEGDAVALVAAMRDPAIAHWTFVPWPYGEADARAFLARQARERLAGDALALAIEPMEEEAQPLLGGIGIEPLDLGAGRGEIGYWVARDARGRGIATRAVRLLSAWALAGLGLQRLEILPFAGNAASERVAEQAGFRRERVLPAHRVHRATGEVRDMTLFSLSR
jgi:RimJ/RimL family protein N-acetyltransferase